MIFRIFLIRLCGIHSLIFFITVCLFSCSSKPENEISIIWDNERAIGLRIPYSQVNKNDIPKIEIRLEKEENHVSILGELKDQGTYTEFKPLIPFTKGQQYGVFLADLKLGDVLIPELLGNEANLSLLEIYPTQDTVPENLLKLFLKFSKPMREGQSLTYLSLIKDGSDTLSGVFLDLQPELWNEDQTMLTVWLDPGRIKRDLIPNLEMGAPLNNSENYTLVVSEDWKGLNGGKLGQNYTKNFIVTSRDSISPDTNEWLLNLPKPDSKIPLQVDFIESLDYSLLNDVFKLKNEDDQEISGTWEIGKEEKSILFLPSDNWESGKYKIEIENRLEDLAGNNLKRLFEIDLKTTSKTKIESSLSKLEFEIK